MARTAQSIIDRAAKLLQDDTNIAWPTLELLEWLNDGQRELVLGKPDAYVINRSLRLMAGTKQVLPSDGNVFMRLTRNMGADGNTPGRAILPIPMQVFDEQNPNWHRSPAAPEAQNYVYDDRDKKTFYVYPPQPSVAGYAEVVYSATPPECAAADSLAVGDLFISAILDYVLYRAYSKDAEYTRNDAKATGYYQSFISLIAGKTNGEMKNDASNSPIGNQRAGKKAA